MSKYKYYLFDLDGTISQSAPGIRMSLEHALNKLGVEAPNLDDYTIYIGPPLIDTFINYCKLPKDIGLLGTEYYREYYNEKGKYHNSLYDGFEEVLKYLKNEDVKVAVCTSKYDKFAEEIVEILGVTDYFDAICGSNLDGSRKDKKDLIPYAVKKLGGDIETDRESVLMVGDTHFDARGARLCDVDFVGVEYGYGAKEPMENENARVFVKTTQELLELLKN